MPNSCMNIQRQARQNAFLKFFLETDRLFQAWYIKFEPLRKKDQSADTNTHTPEIKKFLPYPSEKTQRSKDADGHNPSETAFSNPLRNSRPQGRGCILNGMAPYKLQVVHHCMHLKPHIQEPFVTCFSKNKKPF